MCLWHTPIEKLTHLFFVLLKLLLQFFVFALGVFDLLTHFHVLQVQLGELLLLGLNVLVQLVLFPGGGTAFLLATRSQIQLWET